MLKHCQTFPGKRKNTFKLLGRRPQLKNVFILFQTSQQNTLMCLNTFSKKNRMLHAAGLPTWAEAAPLLSVKLSVSSKSYQEHEAFQVIKAWIHLDMFGYSVWYIWRKYSVHCLQFEPSGEAASCALFWTCGRTFPHEQLLVSPKVFPQSNNHVIASDGMYDL